MWIQRPAAGEGSRQETLGELVIAATVRQTKLPEVFPPKTPNVSFSHMLTDIFSKVDLRPAVTG